MRSLARAVLLASAAAAFCYSQVSVVTQHNDNNRTGANLSETILNTSNVNPSLFGLLFTLPVDAQVYAQPLYVSNLNINSGTHNVLYVATESNSLYAFDADTPGAPLWHTNLEPLLSCNPTTPPAQTLTWQDCTSPNFPQMWYNMFPYVGITATPVIDLSTGTMYVVNVAFQSSQQVQFLHAIDIKTGTEKFGGPVQITASVSGNGDGGTTVTYNPVHQRLRPALTLINGLVVVSSAAYSDWGPYHGWVLSYNASTLAQVGVWCDTPNGTLGGIWQSGGGLVADASGNLYLTSGNGDFDGTTNFGMSFVKLSTSSGLSEKDYFAPFNEQAMSLQDLDLGSAGPMAIPGTKYLIGGGKTGILYLLDSTNLGKFNSSTDQVVQEFQATTPVSGNPSHIHGGEVYWNGPAPVGQQVYLWGSADQLKAFSFNGSSFQTTPTSHSTVFSPATGPLTCVDPNGFVRTCMPGGFLSISANGSTTGTGILWANAVYSGTAEGTTVPGILYAFDASNVATPLWSSKQISGDDFGYFAKYVAPTVINGKVYLATFSNQVAVYGLLPPSFALSVTPASAQTVQGSNATYTVNVFPRGGYTGSVSLSIGGLPTGASAQFSPSSLNSGNSTLTVTAGASTPTGSYQLTITGQGTGVSSHVVMVTFIVGAGTLAGSGNSSSTGVNLTTEGTIDWVHWGDSSLNRKAGVTAQLSTYTVVGSGSVIPWSSGPRAVSWTDGTPTASSTNNLDDLFINGVGQGFSITAPADTTSRTVVVHVGGWNSGGTLTAQLSDGSASNYTDTTTVVSGSYNRNYTLAYNALSAGQTLTVTWTMSSGTGNVALTAAAMTTPGTPASITASGGTPQSATVKMAFTTALQATVKDAGNNPVNGAMVTFTAPGSGASGTFTGGVTTATVSTNSSGVATAPTFTANSQTGSYSVTASVSGVSTPASFSLTNTTGVPASIAASGGTPQSATVNTAFVTALQATVKDGSNNPVNGATVTFTAPGSEASGTFTGGATTASVSTNSSGVATAPTFTANSQTGSYSVTASVSGVSTPASFSLTNTAASGGGSLAGSGTSSLSAVNLTTEGTSDWVHWGDSSLNRKAGVTAQLSTYTVVGSGTVFGWPTGPFAASWTDGTPTASSTNDLADLYINGVGQGFSITAPASTTSRTVMLYVGGWKSGGTLTAHLSDGSAPDFTDTTTVVSTSYNRSYTLTYSAASAGQTLTVTWKMSSGTGNVALNAAAMGTPGGVPASITASGGTPQSAAVNTAFVTALQATVKDGSNNPVNGATVTFTAPGSGASGTFTGGAATANVSTNSSGVATAPTFTANSQTGSYSVTASVSGVSTPASFSLTNTTGVPASITASGGTPQSAAVNTAFVTALQATVKDGSNNPVNGATVTFTAPGSGASGTFTGGATTASVSTNSSGVATAPTFTANSQTGSYSVTASVSGVSTPASFSLTNTTGVPASITTSGGTPQSAAVNTAFVTALLATVKDGSNNPVNGATVTFTAPGSGASGTFTGGATTASVSTNSSGVATAPTFTANSQTGSYSVTASVSGVSTPASFSLTNTTGVPASIAASGGTPQSAAVNTAFVTALQATVKDGSNNPVNGATVTFTAPGSGASGTFTGGAATANVSTNSSGVATAPTFKANSQTGSYSVTASVSGVSTPASFSLTNTTGVPASITASGGTPQSAAVNTAFVTALQATVKDGSNNPVNGATVTFTAPGSGASGTFTGGATTASVSTNSSGVATAPTFTANSQTGSYSVTASVSGVSTPASFSLTNTAASGGGSLAGSGTSSLSAVNLTTEGTSDWVHWGDSSLNRKAGVTAQLSTYTVVGSGTVFAWPTGPFAASWTDGTPTASSTNDLADLYINGVGQGFSITAPASTTSRTVVLHVGGWNSGGTLTAHLSDGSASDFTDTTTVVSTSYNRSYTLTYSAASAGQTLTVTWKMSSGTGNVALNAAAMQ